MVEDCSSWIQFSDSPFSRIYRACKEWLHWTGNKDFYARARFVAFMDLQTIMNDWEAGLGPGGKPYWMCSHEELREGYTGGECPF